MNNEVQGIMAICKCGKAVAASDKDSDTAPYMGRIIGNAVMKGCVIILIYYSADEVDVQQCECE